jgi:hypothetical protein
MSVRGISSAQRLALMTRSEIQRLVERCTFRDWTFRLMDKGDGFLVQVVFWAQDAETGSLTEQRCRKWYISSHACRQEVVGTCWAAVKAAVLHEAAEDFRYQGKPIYAPHADPDALATNRPLDNTRMNP